MYQSIQNSICNGFFTNYIVPAYNRQLTGDDRGFAAMPVLNDFHQIHPLLFFQMCESKVVKYEHLCLGELLNKLVNGSINAAHLGSQQQLLKIEVGYTVTLGTSLMSQC